MSGWVVAALVAAGVVVYFAIGAVSARYTYREALAEYRENGMPRGWGYRNTPKDAARSVAWQFLLAWPISWPIIGVLAACEVVGSWLSPVKDRINAWITKGGT